MQKIRYILSSALCLHHIQKLSFLTRPDGGLKDKLTCIWTLRRNEGKVDRLENIGFKKFICLHEYISYLLI